MMSGSDSVTMSAPLMPRLPAVSTVFINLHADAGKNVHRSYQHLNEHPAFMGMEYQSCIAGKTAAHVLINARNIVRDGNPDRSRQFRHTDDSHFRNAQMDFIIQQHGKLLGRPARADIGNFRQRIMLCRRQLHWLTFSSMSFIFSRVTGFSITATNPASAASSSTNFCVLAVNRTNRAFIPAFTMARAISTPDWPGML